MSTRRRTRQSTSRVFQKSTNEQLTKSQLNTLNTSLITSPASHQNISIKNTTTNLSNISRSPERDISRFLNNEYFDTSPKTDYTYGDSGSYKSKMLGRPWISPNMSRPGLRKKSAGYLSMRTSAVYGDNTDSEGEVEKSSVDSRGTNNSSRQGRQISDVHMEEGCQLSTLTSRSSTASTEGGSDRLLRSECHRRGGGLCGHTACIEAHRRLQSEELSRTITTTTTTTTRSTRHNNEEERDVISGYRGLEFSSDDEDAESGIDLASDENNSARVTRDVNLTSTSAQEPRTPLWRSFLISLQCLRDRVTWTPTPVTYSVRNTWGLDGSKTTYVTSESQSNAEVTSGVFSSDNDSETEVIIPAPRTRRRRRNNSNSEVSTSSQQQSVYDTDPFPHCDTCHTEEEDVEGAAKTSLCERIFRIICFLPRLICALVLWPFIWLGDCFMSSAYVIRQCGFTRWVRGWGPALKKSTGSSSYGLLPFYIISTLLTLPFTAAAKVVRASSAIYSGESVYSVFHTPHSYYWSTVEDITTSSVCSTTSMVTTKAVVHLEEKRKKKKRRSGLPCGLCCCLPLLLLALLSLLPFFYPALRERETYLVFVERVKPSHSWLFGGGAGTGERVEDSEEGWLGGVKGGFMEYMWPTGSSDDGEIVSPAAGLKAGQQLVDKSYLDSLLAKIAANKLRLDEHERRLTGLNAHLTETSEELKLLKISITEILVSVRSLTERVTHTEADLKDLVTLSARLSALEKLVQDQKSAIYIELNKLEKNLKNTVSSGDGNNNAEVVQITQSLVLIHSKLSDLETGQNKLTEAHSAIDKKISQLSIDEASKRDHLSMSWEEKHSAIETRLSAAIAAAVAKAKEAVQMNQQERATSQTQKGTTIVEKESWSEEERANWAREVEAASRKAALNAAREQLDMVLDSRFASWRTKLESTIIVLAEDKSKETASVVAERLSNEIATRIVQETTGSLVDARVDKTMKTAISNSVHEAMKNHQAAVSPTKINADDPGYPGDDRVRFLIGQALDLFAADRLARPDFALESAGGSVVGTRCTQTYNDAPALFSLFGVPLLKLSRSPRTLIEATSQPGECWAFRGSTGQVVIQLSSKINITGVTLEHIPRSLSPNQRIDSAPNDFLIKGLKDEHDIKGVVLGNFTYTDIGPSLQTFEIVEPMAFNFVELSILNNHGNKEYTCVYRLRVHGIPLPD